MIRNRFSNIYSQRRVQIIILLGVCFILFFLNLNQWDLWNPDEPRYAQVAREMVNGGDWILMHFNGKIYGDKPPLFFWFIALSSFLYQGFNSFSVRFPSALFGTLTALITYILGRNLFSSRTGFLSSLILVTSLEFAYISTRANIDATLTFFTTASFYCFYQWHRYSKGERGQQRSIRDLSIYGFYTGMALATLAKGPIGFILPLLVSLCYLFIQRDWKGVRAMRLLTGMLLFLAIVLSWYLPAILKGGQSYLNETLLHQTIDRYSKGWSHVKPIYYYFINFPIQYLPWIFFLPAGIAYGFSKEMVEKRKEFLFLFIWFVVIFLFFSLSKGKRSLYLLPLFPSASLMVGKVWDDFISTPMESFRKEWISYPFHVIIGLMLIAGAAIPWVVSMRFPSYLPYSFPVTFLMVGGSLAMFVLHRFKHREAAFFLLIIMMAGGFFYTLRVVFPLVNPYKSARFISGEVTSRIQPGERLGLYGGFGTGPFNFYTGIVPMQEMEGKEDLIHFLQSRERVFCLLKFRDFYSFQSMEERPEVQWIARYRVGDDDIVLISNR